MPKPKERKPSAAEIAARARGMKGNTELAEQFGVNNDYVRELVKVEELPTPPSTETMQQAHSGRAKQSVDTLPVEQMLLKIFSEEADEIAVRLERVGMRFDAHMKQDLIDHLFTVVALSQQGMRAGGGAIARR